jgi:hypothetical protein
MNKYGNL